jgi:hypothetical protein
MSGPTGNIDEGAGIHVHFSKFSFFLFLFEIRVVAEHTGVGFFGKLQAQ